MTEAERALRSVHDAAGNADAHESQELAFGPIQMTVHADDLALLDQTVAHAAGGSCSEAWRPLRVVLTTGRTLARDDLPAPLRPPLEHSPVRPSCAQVPSPPSSAMA